MISVTVEDNGLVQRLAQMGGAVRDALERTASALSDELLSRIGDGLNGSILNSRSGALRESLSCDVQPDSAASGVTATVSSSSPYAAMQEYGFSGSEQVAEHLRMMTVAFGKPVANPHDILVRSFSRQVDYAARHFISAPLADMHDEMAAAFDDAVRQEVQP